MKIVRLTDKQRAPFNHDFIRQTDGQRRNSRGGRALRHEIRRLTIKRKDGRAKGRSSGFFLKKEKTEQGKGEVRLGGEVVI